LPGETGFTPNPVDEDNTGVISGVSGLLLPAGSPGSFISYLGRGDRRVSGQSVCALAQGERQGQLGPANFGLGTAPSCRSADIAHSDNGRISFTRTQPNQGSRFGPNAGGHHWTGLGIPPRIRTDHQDLMSSGQLAFIKVGRATRIHRRDLYDYVLPATNANNATPHAGVS
jgi:hypothetical protein